MPVAAPIPRMTATEYLHWEPTQPDKYDYYRGDVFNMSGTSIPHNLIKNGASKALSDQVGQCLLVDESVKLEVFEDEFFTHPDIMVSCDARDKGSKFILKFPFLIIEVLSPGTEAYDLGTKLKGYLQLPSLQHYVLLRQEKIEALHYRRQGADWLLHIYDTAADVLRLGEWQLPLAACYPERLADYGFVF